MLQNGQTEPVGWNRRRTRWYVEVKFVRSKKAQNEEKSNKMRFFNKINLFWQLTATKIRIFIAFLRSGLFLHPLIFKFQTVNVRKKTCSFCKKRNSRKIRIYGKPL